MTTQNTTVQVSSTIAFCELIFSLPVSLVAGSPGFAQTASTCSVLRNLQGDDEWFSGGCTVNPSCTAVRGFVTSNIVTYNGLNIFPCANPPAVRILISESGIIPHIDTTVTRTTSGITYFMNLLGTLDIVLEWSDDGTSFDIQVKLYKPHLQFCIAGDTCASKLFRSTHDSNLTTNSSSLHLCLPSRQVAIATLLTYYFSVPTGTGPTQGPPVSDGSVRLTYGSSDSIGRLEVLLDGAWGTVCDQSGFTFTHTEGDVVCRQLGYGQSAYIGSSQLYTSGTPPTDLPIAMTDVSCTSGATRLQSCTFSRSTGGCTHSDDVGVQCSICRLYFCDDGQCTQATACDGTVECNDGSDENSIVCSE